MRRGARGLLLVVIGLGAVVAVITIAIVLARGVEKGTVVELTVSGEIAEERDESLFGKMIGGNVTLVGDLRAVFEKVRRDDAVPGVMTVIKSFSAGGAKIQEIRDAVLALRRSGKWAVAFMETAGELAPANGAYWLASAFDEVHLAPSGDVNLVGLKATVPFFRGTLDKLGVYPDFDSIGEYKNAKDIFTEKEFTEAHRRATTELIEDLYRAMTSDIASAREMSAGDVEALLDRGPFTGKEALEEGLIDRLAYYDEFREAVKERAGGRLRTLAWGEYLDRRKGLGTGAHKIVVVHGTGPVLQGKSGFDPMGGPFMGSDSVAGAIREAREDDATKAIILRIDSPGGSAVASDVILREVTLAREKVPVVASMSDVAASGGYYIACRANKIVAEPTTITASIGVVFGKFVNKGFYDWIGMGYGEVTRGRNAGLWSDMQRWTPEEKEQFYWKFVRKIYDQFVGHVAEGRGMTLEEVDRIGRGRVWSGTRAKELGLIDEVGGFSTAVRIAKELAEIPEDEEVRFVVLPRRPTWWENLWGNEETSTRLPPYAQAILRETRPLVWAAMMSGEPALLLADPVAVSP